MNSMIVLHVERLAPLAVVFALLLMLPFSSFALEVDPVEGALTSSDAAPVETLHPAGTPEPTITATVEDTPTTSDAAPEETLPPAGTPEPYYEEIISDGYLEAIVDNQGTIIGILTGIIAFLGVMAGLMLMVFFWGRFK